jgi:hypothetical protein
MGLSPRDSRLPQQFLEQELSPLRSRSSHDSDDSLRALELLDGVAPRTLHRRSFSGSSFGLERDLLPLSASLSEPDEVRSIIGEKSIGLTNGTPVALNFECQDIFQHSLGVALVVGLQVSSKHFFSLDKAIHYLCIDWVRYIVCQCLTQRIEVYRH